MEIDGARIVTRSAIPDRDLSPERLLALVGQSRTHYVSGESLVLMPRGDREIVAPHPEVVSFVNFGVSMESIELESVVRGHGYKPADPWLTAQININEPDFASLYPNCTQWKARGSWHFLGFRLHLEWRVTYLHHRTRHPSEWWHAIVPIG